MNFSHAYEYLNAGDVVKVLLDSQANVRLIDSSNFASFQCGSNFEYFGGLAKRSPAILRVPYSGMWHIVIDLGGYAGSVNYSIQVVKS